MGEIHILWGKFTGTKFNGFAYFSRKSYGPRGLKKKGEHAFQPVPVRRFIFLDYTSVFFFQAEGGGPPRANLGPMMLLQGAKKGPSLFALNVCAAVGLTLT